MIFTRIRMWGKLSNLDQWEKNTHMSSFPCLTQPLSLNNCCWWLRQLIVLGVGWQDFQSSPTHTLHHGWLHYGWGKTTTITHAGDFTTLPMTVLKTLTHFWFSHLLCWLFILTPEWDSCSFSRAGISWVFTHVVLFCGFVDGMGESFPHGLICGLYIVVPHAQVRRL